MQVDVPAAFAQFLRQRRLLSLSVAFAVVLVLSLLAMSFLPSHSMLGAVAIPLTWLFLLLLSWRSPLRYELRESGVWLTAGGLGRGLTGPAYMHAFVWRYDPLVAVELTHWNGLPALRLRTQKQTDGFLMPLAREDVERVMEFLTARISAGKNA